MNTYSLCVTAFFFNVLPMPSCDDADHILKLQLFFLYRAFVDLCTNKVSERTHSFIVFRLVCLFSISIDVVTLQIFGFWLCILLLFLSLSNLFRMVFCSHSNALFLFSSSLFFFFFLCITKKCVKMFDNLNNGPDYHRWWLCDLIGDSVSKPLF